MIVGEQHQNKDADTDEQNSARSFRDERRINVSSKQQGNYAARKRGPENEERDDRIVPAFRICGHGDGTNATGRNGEEGAEMRGAQSGPGRTGKCTECDPACSLHGRDSSL
jgi:hypothetical protein